ncbi:hypothetical protein RF11_08602 [Thelohanellus kitauei]|uniref:Uncharacterized protein n=1 Tax=Thelohanellus kitauei TaxID=669202 RepID=A0A0C2MVD4_THEKT|nr:hypothetical protein RF11_08602 [Thelohanellus kitauei]
MDCCVTGILTPSIRDKVCEDDKILMWIARSSVTAISFVSSSFDLPQNTIKKYWGQPIALYFKPALDHYLHIHNFHTIQILMSHLDPELLLKYLLFNVMPSLRKQNDLATPISSILASKEFYGGDDVRFLMILIYNALLERHFIASIENPEYQWLERQLIHCLILGDDTLKNIKIKIINYQTLPFHRDPQPNKNFDQALENVSCVKTIRNEKKYSLKPEYANIIQVFYFLNKFNKYLTIHKRIKKMYQMKKCKFQLPEIPELRDSFKGMNNFMFSNAYSNLLMTVLVRRYRNIFANFTNIVDNLVITSMSLCLMLKVSIAHNIPHELQKTIDLLFGIRDDLGGLNVMIFLVQWKHKVNNAIFISVVDYMIELSRIQSSFFSDLSDKTYHMTLKAKVCQELALKAFQK